MKLRAPVCRMQKIAVVEDDENIREAVVYALRASGFEAVGLGSAKELYNLVSGGRKTAKAASGDGAQGEGHGGALDESHGGVSLLILDVMLPGEDGLSILRKIRGPLGFKDLPIIMLTAKGSEFDKVTALDLGADDYITKPFGVMEMISRVNAVLRRSRGAAAGAGAVADAAGAREGGAGDGAATGGEAAETRGKTAGALVFGGLIVDHDKRIVTLDGETVALTFKEYELLYFLLVNAGLALSRDRIIEEVWGYDFEGESRTLDMHIRSLRQKLGAAGGQITTIRNFGYRLGK